MVRLIRLASVDNCNFRTSFGNDIKIEPGSKLAVLNATFETKISEISVNSRNNQIKFTPNVDGGVVLNNTVVTLPIKNYSGELGIRDFWKEVGRTLSNTLGYRDTLFDATLNPGGPKVNTGVFSEFEMKYDEYNAQFPTPVNPVRISYGFSPMLSAFGSTYSLAFPQGSANSPLLRDATADDAIVATAGDPDSNTDAERFSNQVSMLDSEGNQVGTKIRAIAADGVVMSKGNGLFMARVRLLVDNTNAGVEDNGFGIGLSRSLENLKEEDEIEANQIHAQIRVNRPGESYKYRVNGGAEIDSGLNPRRYDVNDPLTDHDIMWIRVGKDESSAVGSATRGKYCLQGGVWQDNGSAALETVFFSVELPAYFLQYDFLHPYMFFNGTDTVCQADAVAFTPSVTHAMESFNLTGPNTLWVDQDVVNGTASPFSFGRHEYKITNILKTGNGTAYPATVIGNIVPQVDPDRFDNRAIRETRLSIHADILKYLGFGQSFSGYELISQKMGMDDLQFKNYILYEGKGGPDLDSDDNFIVESISLPVDSYDASSQYYGDGDPFQDIGLTDSVERLGRRKNILITIPATDISKLVQYEASTPQFIDIRNTTTLNERNLEFRILDKDFNPVETGGSKSILTLLLSGPGER